MLQMLGNKPNLADGDDNDDIAADISNRKIAKLFMVRYISYTASPIQNA